MQVIYGESGLKNAGPPNEAIQEHRRIDESLFFIPNIS